MSDSSSRTRRATASMFALALLTALGAFTIARSAGPGPDLFEKFAAPPAAALSAAQIDPLDCDSLEDALRTEVDTIRLLSTYGMPGDTVDLPFWIKNDSILAAYSLVYTFDTSLLEPLVFYDTIINCNPTCDTIIDQYIWTYMGLRAINGGFTTLGRYEPKYPTHARVFAVPLVAEIDSVAPGADVLAYQRFRVKQTAQPGCVGTFQFITRPVWLVDTSVTPPDSTFWTCLMNELVEIWDDYPEQVIPIKETGIFRVGETADFACGDANGDGSFNIGEATYLISFIFSAGPGVCNSPGVGDIDCNGKINIGDVSYLIAHIFSGGPAPCCPEWYTP
ncbi:MAG TPA: dockerin type I repeat-containing protein [candidate division Zixibacteria bacterium]|nr:dockerin type I repeat-containing protein [candidate division Zixibacteria bacterium]